jgi:lipoyl(octanoyl) transferase
MTRRLFGTLEVCHDQVEHSAAMNMAIDEALLECVTEPIIRFYRWHSPALSFGYFGRFADVTSYEGKHDLVRRWTGGGTVLHGEDLTYSIVIPANEAAFTESSTSIYEKIHRALTDALSEIGKRAELLPVSWVYDRRKLRKGDLHIAQRRTRDRCSLDSDCFKHPVRADVMINGRKIAGAAQRRTRRGLLQQGSIQGIDIGLGLAERFAQALSMNCSERKIADEALNRARELAEKKYGTESWLRKH